MSDTTIIEQLKKRITDLEDAVLARSLIIAGCANVGEAWYYGRCPECEEFTVGDNPDHICGKCKTPILNAEVIKITDKDGRKLVSI